MSATPTPPGWYEDPYGEATWRWWDGSTWSTATRLDGRVASASAAGATTAMSAAPPDGTPVEHMDVPDRQDRRRATIGLAVLTLLALVIVASAILFTDSPNHLAVDDLPGADEQAPPTDGTGEAPAEEPLDSDPTTPSDAPEEGTDEDAGAGSEGEPAEGEEEATGGSVELDFDGVCTVEDDADDVDDPRPWDFDACTSAPITLDAGEERWIVVVASLSEGGYDEEAARDRAASEGFAGNLLWSSHYPSLNPDLWVVYDGPYAGQEEARAAAAELGGGSYPRVLSDDDDDRYCVAADGCVGDDGDG